MTTSWQISGNYSVSAGKLVDIGAKPAMGIDPSNTTPLQLSNTGHPAANTISIGRPTKSTLDALGLSWTDNSGTNSAQYAPFNWRSA